MNDKQRWLVAQPITPDRQEFTNEVVNSFGPNPVGPHETRNLVLAVLGAGLLGRALSRRGRSA